MSQFIKLKARQGRNIPFALLESKLMEDCKGLPKHETVEKVSEFCKTHNLGFLHFWGLCEKIIRQKQ